MTDAKPEHEMTCEERVKAHMKDRLQDLKLLWESYQEDPEAYVEDDEGYELGNLYEYGLDFGYVPPGTFSDQEEPYFRYQLSTGGPGDEFRFYTYGPPDFTVHKVEYWFLDWFDGAKRTLHGREEQLLIDLFQSFFADAGVVRSEYRKAQEL